MDNRKNRGKPYYTIEVEDDEGGAILVTIVVICAIASTVLIVFLLYLFMFRVEPVSAMGAPVGPAVIVRGGSL